MTPAHAPFRIAVALAGMTLGASTLSAISPSSRLTHVLARSRVEVSIPQVAGVVGDTDEPRPVLIRAVGRGLPAGWGAAALPTPVLTFYDGPRLVAEDRGSAIAAPIAALARLAGAFPIDANALSAFTNYGSALAPQLARGAFTFVTRSGDRASGLVLFELYDLGSATSPPFVRNFSFRGFTGPGDAVMIVGFIVSGETSLRLLVRGIGPTLASFGIAGVAPDPRLAIYASGASCPLAQNDDWANDADVANAARRVQAFALPANSRDAALLVALPPGSYTGQLTVAAHTAGHAMFELYVVD